MLPALGYGELGEVVEGFGSWVWCEGGEAVEVGLLWGGHDGGW